MAFVIGLDWGGAGHPVCVIDKESGAVVDRFEARHDAAGLREMTRRFARRGAATDLPVAIERPSGLIVDALVAAGHPVAPIHPNAVKASRPRYRASGAKDDRGDAYLPADPPRADGHCFRALAPPRTPSEPCARCCAAATTWWRPASRSPTSSAPCSKASGPGPRRSSPTAPGKRGAHWSLRTSRAGTGSRRPG